MTTAKTLVSLNDQNSTDWELSVAELSSSRAPRSFDIKAVITDFEVYEHINKPYLTGSLVLIDAERVIERFDIQGAETLTIEMQRANTHEIKPIKKVFTIDKIRKIARGNETTQAVHLHFIEDIGFKANLYTVNKAYTGQPENMIATIAEDYFNKEVVSSAEKDVANAMQVIVPNMSPLEAMMWIKNRSTTSEGYPFYLFTNFATDQFYFLDLGAMLSQTPINEKFPYMYSQSNATVDNANRMQVIYDYNMTDHENTLGLMQKGVIGAEHSFYDVTAATYVKKKFNVHEDVFDQTEKLNPRQNRPIVSYDHVIDDTLLSDYTSRKMHNIYATRNYVDKKAYTEENDEGAHTRKVSSIALQNLLSKNPLEITIDGRDFIEGSNSKSIGNIVKIIFKATDHGHQGQKIDRKLSGDYLIVGARHSFSVEKCRTKLLISKIANYNSDIYTQGPNA